MLNSTVVFFIVELPLVLGFWLPGQKDDFDSWPGSAAEDSQNSAQSLGRPDPDVREQLSKYQDFLNIASKNLPSSVWLRSTSPEQPCEFRCKKTGLSRFQQLTINPFPVHPQQNTWPKRSYRFGDPACDRRGRKAFPTPSRQNSEPNLSAATPQSGSEFFLRQCVI